MDVYSKENCDKAVAIFERLVAGLCHLPDTADDEQKLAQFETAVEALNTLSYEADGIIETEEREELCELCNVIAEAAGMDPYKYGEGEGPASIWRDW